MNDEPFYPVLDVKEFFISETSVNIVVKITCPSDVRVRSPKVRAIFEAGAEDRRLPLVVEASYIANDLESNIIYAKYEYFFDYLFMHKEPNAKIKLRFALAYGDEYVENMPFSLSRDVSFENEKFKVTALKEEGYFTFEEIKIENEAFSIGRRILLFLGKGIKELIRFLYNLILYLIGIVLIPLFCVDAVMAKLNLSEQSMSNRSTGLKWFLSHVRWRYSSFCKKNLSLLGLKEWYLKKTFCHYSSKPVVQNRISFLSSRRDDMTGNLGFIYDMVKNDSFYDIHQLLDPNSLLKMSFGNIKKLSYLCATSKVILIDDFFPILNHFQLNKETKLIQLWHACGAFKTFGFSRLGKRGGPTQQSLNHRNYDYAIVSSQEIAKYYAEGFGIPTSHVVATGVPRTDIFFGENYKNKVIKEFYTVYPKLRNKKIILFAPTFRGNGKESAFYPENRFDPIQVYEKTNHEYAILIKHHPFVQNQMMIPEEYKDYIIDMSEQSELNDLLFVSDVVITDYSSLIFEASLLNIPMLFYAYDLRRYIATRDFYYEYELFVPGKIVSSQTSLIQAINNQDYEQEKIDDFKKRFFDHLDGRSTDRVVQLIRDIMDKH
jgi:Putative glycosyl/glycerophosphate transferases involved in teichoic acid biosynthesis TagF/TagB/EpsJ/RodC